VAGRAGRGERPGEVFLQTYRPKHYAVQAALHHDYDAFYAHELAYRRSAGYPPFRRMANFLVESEDPQLAERHAVLLRRIVRETRETLGGNAGVIGPAQAMIRRVKKKYRWNLALLSANSKYLNTLTRAVAEAFVEAAGTRRVQLKTDVDPYGF